MNYDKARQLKDGGWHWTTMNDGVVRAAGPCITFRKPLDPARPFEPIDPADIVRCEPHATQEEAERHFYDWSLASLKESEFTTAQHCEYGPHDTWTNKSLGNKGEWGYFSDVFLCDAHRRPEMVAELRPFHPNIEIIHS